MKQKLHPALALFAEMFERSSQMVSANRKVAALDYYVPRSAFIAELKSRGIDAPSNIVDHWRWEEDIGMPRFVYKLIMAEHKRLGTKPTLSFKAGWRQRVTMLKNRGKWEAGR